MLVQAGGQLAGKEVVEKGPEGSGGHKVEHHPAMVHGEQRRPAAPWAALGRLSEVIFPICSALVRHTCSAISQFRAPQYQRDMDMSESSKGLLG